MIGALPPRLHVVMDRHRGKFYLHLKKNLGFSSMYVGTGSKTEECSNFHGDSLRNKAETINKGVNRIIRKLKRPVFIRTTEQAIIH